MLRWVRLYDERGNLEPRPRSGRPKKLSTEQVKYARKLAKKKNKSVREVTAILGRGEKKASYSTVLRSIK